MLVVVPGRGDPMIGAPFKVTMNSSYPTGFVHWISAWHEHSFRSTQLMFVIAGGTIGQKV